ncbi:2OG-Fe(II) oxygenase [Leeia sp.]|uniref:2OG-Fe(II) oxygenase n=1 Tax=Leeia sp. TaxID=2884678 RepID=UPI0035B31796
MNTCATSLSAYDPLPASAGFCRVFPGFLTAEACLALIAEREAQPFADAGHDYPPSYRNNMRQVWDNEALAQTLAAALQTLAPACLSLPDAAGQVQPWQFEGINPRFRCCRYEPGQQFQLHQDGVHWRGPAIRSGLTFMIYLTDGDAFEGGDTVFYSAGPGGHEDGRPAQEIGRVRPRAGSLILFDHAIWHAGAVLVAGRKHVLRSDVLYRSTSAAMTAAHSPFMPGHQGYVWTLARLAPGVLASGGRDSHIRVWRDDGTPITVLQGHTQSVLGLAALTAQTLLSVSRDRSLRWWHWPSGECLRTVQAHAAAILDVQVLSEACIATAGADGLIHLFDATGQRQRTLTGHQGWVWQLAVLPAGRLASASEDGSLRIWSADGTCLQVLAGDQPLRTLLWADGLLWSGDVMGQIQAWRPEGDRWCVCFRHKAHRAAVRRLRALAPGWMGSVGEDGQLAVWKGLAVVPSHQALLPNFATDLLPLRSGALLSSAYDGGLRVHEGGNNGLVCGMGKLVAATGGQAPAGRPAPAVAGLCRAASSLPH